MSWQHAAFPLTRHHWHPPRKVHPWSDSPSHSKLYGRSRVLQDRISGPLRHSSPLVLLPTSSRRLGRSVARSSRLVSYTPVAYRRLGEFRSNRPKRDHVSPALGIARPERSACVTCERTHVISPSCTESRTGADKAGDCAGPRLCSTTTRTVRPLPSQRRRSRPRPQLHSASPSGPTARRASQPPLLPAPTRLRITRTT